MPRLKFLIPNLRLGATRGKRDFDLRLGGCWIYASEIYFLIFLENKWRKKSEVTLSLILWFNQRLGGYSIWSVRTSRTIYDQDFGAWAPHSLDATRSTWKTTRSIQEEGQKHSTDAQSTWSTRRRLHKYSMLARLSYEELGGLSDPGQRDCS